MLEANRGGISRAVTGTGAPPSSVSGFSSDPYHARPTMDYCVEGCETSAATSLGSLERKTTNALELYGGTQGRGQGQPGERGGGAWAEPGADGGEALGAWHRLAVRGVVGAAGHGWSLVARWEACDSGRAWPGGAKLWFRRVGSSSGWPARRTVPLVAAVAGCDPRPSRRMLPPLVATWRPCCALEAGLAPSN